MPVVQVDVAVVGASPAGLRAAWAAAKGGASVALLEPRPRLDAAAAPAAVAFDFLWTAAFKPPDAAVRRRLDGVRLVSPGGSELAVEAPLSILRREALDPWLARAAEAHGARLVLGARGLDAPERGHLCGEGIDVRARVTIFADGARTLARRFLAPVERPDAITWGAALDVDAPGAGDAREIRISLGSFLAGGRAQLNPLDDGTWSHWTFYKGDPAHAERIAREALGRDAARLGWSEDVARRATYRGAAPDPVYTLPGQLVADGVMVAGGAAGQGGLEAGFAAGELAGRVAAAAVRAGRSDAEALKPYERDWKRAHLAAYRGLARHVDRLAGLRDADLDALLRAWEGRRVPVRDLVGLAHPAWWRRAEARGKALARNPFALPLLARVAWRTALGDPRRRSAQSGQILEPGAAVRTRGEAP